MPLSLNPVSLDIRSNHNESIRLFAILQQDVGVHSVLEFGVGHLSGGKRQGATSSEGEACDGADEMVHLGIVCGCTLVAACVYLHREMYISTPG